VFLAVCVLIFESGSKNIQKAAGKKDVVPTTKITIEDLAKGVKNETLWTEEAEKEVASVKQTQIETKSDVRKLQQYVETDKVSKDELAEIIKNVQTSIEGKYNKLLDEEIAKIREQTAQKLAIDQMESQSFVRKTKIKKVVDYIPAGSYVEAKLISGVDAGVGTAASADPRHVLLRITGMLTSAGFGAEYLKSDRLVGCLLQAQASGDISSEKVYPQAVLLTCAKDKQTVVEIPVKGFVNSVGKAGIRGEVVSREGDMVLKSFLSGAVGGFGSGVAQYSQPHLNVAGGALFSEGQSAKNIAMSGLGSGFASSSDRLADYFIKCAEQYQPVISINEGV
jgi:conjugal transfer pilus assembly protein TraB